MATAQTTFKSKAGKSFPTEAEADRHDLLISARQAYKDARAIYTKALAETNRTADDKVFDITTMRTYYLVVEPMGWNKPTIREVAFYLWNCDINEHDQGVIRQKRSDGEGWTTWRISELYYYSDNAKAKLAEAMEQHIAWMQEDLEQMKNVPLQRN